MRGFIAPMAKYLLSPAPHRSLLILCQLRSTSPSFFPRNHRTMKPLSIGSAVVGLIAGVFRIAPILYHFITHTQGAPKTASQILDEVNSITLALERLQVYVMGAVNANVAWRTMLSLRNIVATLTACVVTYSDLERVVNKCVDEGKVKRVKWLINEGEIVELVQRAQSHKLSVTLMLTILQ
jgi:hypothetical protein